MTTDSSPERPSDVGPAGQAGTFQPEPAAAVPPPPAAQPADASVPQPAADAPAPTPPADPLETLSEATGLQLEDEGGVKHLQTPDGAKDGAVKCARCGATEVKFNSATGMFMCAFCRYEWSEATLDEAMGLSLGIGDLKGTTMSTAAADITDDAALITLKCQGCGAEVVIDTEHNLKARCHWCKSVLSLNNKIPNGAVPDGILPFAISKEQAMASIKAFAEERKSFALKEFAEGFRPENVMGVYLPYMTVDGNVTVRLEGRGETLVSRVRVNKDETAYKVNSYSVERDMDLLVDDVVVETSTSKVNVNSKISTNNIINAILPFDVKNIVRFNANYLGDSFTSQRRDMDVDEAEGYAAQHFLTIARGAAHGTVTGYDRGVAWQAEEVHIHGSRWTSLLLPVWLYGFTEKKRNGYVTHYIAVNGRTGATMGSVPINTGKALGISIGVAAAISVVTWPLGLIALAMA